MTVRFDAVLSRGGPDVLADIFGSQLIELVTTLQKDSANQANLRSLLIEVFSPEVILQSKDKRRNIIDLLRLQEAKELANDIGIKDSEDVFKELKNSTFPRSQFLKLLSFFEISPGIEPEVIDETQNLIEIEPKYSLFKHQRNAISMVLKVLEKSPHRVVLHMPTGAGKTRTAMNIISQYLRISEPTLILWLANSEELCVFAETLT